VPNLLSEGALRVVPHFVRKKSREQVFQRRDARQHALGRESSGVQAAHTVGRDAPSHATSPGRSSSNLVLLPTHSLSAAFEATTLSPRAPPPAETDDLTVADDADSPTPPHSPRISNQTYRNQSGHTWELDFNAAREAYLTKLSTKHSRPVTKLEGLYANHVAHEELIQGRYGVRAMMACDACSEREVECRTYHPECYTWKLKDRPARTFLGWRCASCRLGIGATGATHNFVSCNVQWE
jgi:hypothetical protein